MISNVRLSDSLKNVEILTGNTCTILPFGIPYSYGISGASFIIVFYSFILPLLLSSIPFNKENTHFVVMFAGQVKE